MTYDYNKQVKEIANYLRDREKNIDNFKIGVEFEHFIVDSSNLKTITYWDENGVRDTLLELEKRGWISHCEEGYILGCEKGDKVVSLEPGSQFEFSVNAKKNIEEIISEYKEFIIEIDEILSLKNQELIAVGYHPKTKIDDIKILPKERYNYMFDYFKDKGKYAHNMMKGTASLQVSIDYENEEDYRKKVRLANAISPIMYGICDNGYFFEGEKFAKKSLRTMIWTNMDDSRCGTVKGALEDDFSYEKYAEYILSVEPILIMKDNYPIYTKNKKISDLFNPDDYDVKELEHMMTMVFPDVRTKGFIEIRMMDSIPYPYNFGVVSFLKEIFYNPKNLNKLYDKFKSISYEDITLGKKNIIEDGIYGIYKDKSVIDWAKEITTLVKDNISEKDMDIYSPFYELVQSGKNPYILINENISGGFKGSLKHCILKDGMMK